MRLEAIGDSIWLIEGGNVNFYSFPYPTRSIIVRLEGGKLWVWTPIKLDKDLRAEVDALGTVTHLVSPNKLHHLFLQEWTAAYPDALLWGPQSTIDKRKDLTFHAALGDEPPAEWVGEIDQAWFRGSPFMDEVVFFHKASSTVILADLSENFSEHFLREHWNWWQRPIARLWRIVEGYGYAPLEWRLSFFNRKYAHAALHKMLGWAPRQVVMGHGVWQRENGLAYLQKAFAWLQPKDT